MKTHNITPTLAVMVALALLTFNVASSAAHTAREFITSIGPVEDPAGLAVDLETGNVYVTDSTAQTVDIFGPNGGAPADGVPSQITDVSFQNNGEPQGIAIDNSCYEHQPRLTGKACEEFDLSYGDVYVVANEYVEKGIEKGRVGLEKFKLEGGAYHNAATLLPEFGHGNHEPNGVVVDPNGDVYTVSGPSCCVIGLKKVVKEVPNGNGEQEPVEEVQEISNTYNLIAHDVGYIAVDGSNDLYLGELYEGSLAEGYLGVEKLETDGSGNVLGEEIFTGNDHGQNRPVAVDPVTGGVFVGDGFEIAEYNSSGVLQLTFGSREPVGGSLGIGAKGATAIAVNGPAERVYVANPAKDDVDVFGGLAGPPVFTEAQPAVEGVSRTSAVIAGSVNPESSTASYYFEYAEAGAYQPESSEPYREGGRTAVGALTSDNAPQTVSRIVLSGLRPGTTYHYRMVAANASATVDGPDETFTTAPATPPTAVTGAAVEMSATGATLTGVVSPAGLATSFVFEIGTDTGYTGAKLFGNAGASTGEIPVSAVLQYLVPGTTYHYRLLASSFDGTSYGQDGSFTTPGVAGGIVQPAGVPLIASQSVQFPSLTGAITVAKTHGKTKRRGGAGKRTRNRHAGKTGSRKTGSVGRHKRPRMVAAHRSG